MYHLSSNQKWTWHALFLSQNPVTLDSFRDVQMIILPFFCETTYEDKLVKYVKKVYVTLDSFRGFQMIVLSFFVKLLMQTDL